jgi:dihydrofolate reductase
MRKVTYGGAVSLDFYLAGPDESIDWLRSSEESAALNFVRRLKGQDGGGILVMGGGELGTALIDAGLVDEIGFSVHPVLLGGGIPAFREMSRRVQLELVEARALAKACVLLRYRVVR